MTRTVTKQTLKKEIDEKTVSKSLEFKLTQEEYAAKAMEAADTAQSLGKEEREFESIKKQFKGKIEAFQRVLHTILNIIHEGVENRIVECTEQKNYLTHTVSYIYQGEVMLTRPLEMHERQMEIMGVGKASEVTRELTPEERDLAENHREETSARGSWSAANGPRT